MGRLCEAKESIACRFKLNIKPAKGTGCSYTGSCIHSNVVELVKEEPEVTE